MKIEFRTKEESKKAQEEFFLSLTPAERIRQFYSLMEQLSVFEPQARIEKKNNFLVLIPATR